MITKAGTGRCRGSSDRPTARADARPRRLLPDHPLLTTGIRLTGRDEHGVTDFWSAGVGVVNSPARPDLGRRAARRAFSQ
jgi:hypothetical protein